MSAGDDLTTTVRLACLVEDRTDAEQRALLRVADAVDFRRNRDTVTNTPGDSALYDEAQASRVIGGSHKHVELPRRKGRARVSSEESEGDPMTTDNDGSPSEREG